MKKLLVEVSLDGGVLLLLCVFFFGRRAAPNGFERKVGLFICWERMVCSCASWALSRGAALKKGVCVRWLGCCHQCRNDRLPNAPRSSRVALNCRANSKSAKLEVWKKQRRGDVALDMVGPKGHNLSVEVVSLLFRHKTHAEDVLTCCTHIHGE